MSGTLHRFISAVLVSAAVSVSSCGTEPVTADCCAEETPSIFPDYDGVVIPCNIAPLNFNYLGEGEATAVIEAGSIRETVPMEDGLLDFGFRRWRRMVTAACGGEIRITIVSENEEGERTAYKPVVIRVSDEAVDPYISYRLVQPGYQSWNEMGIYQRCLETYRQSAIYENRLTDGNCVNCHSYPNRNPAKMVFHSRAVFGGTVLVDGDSVEKITTGKGTGLPTLVYPYWHPSGEYIAFSSNVTKQNFFSHNPNRIEVYDTESDVLVYDVKEHRALKSPLTWAEDSFETFPTFTPDGSRLVFCSADAVENLPDDYADVRYSIVAVDFNGKTGEFGASADTLVNSRLTGASASFPRISPDGNFLVYTRHAYGNFSIWHRDADLWLLDLRSGESHPLDAANSDDVDSYHSWSGDSRWMAFSSRRVDGLYTRIFFTRIESDGTASKAFLMPQKNPLEYYSDLMASYNIPELMSEPSTLDKRSVVKALRQDNSLSERKQ